MVEERATRSGRRSREGNIDGVRLFKKALPEPLFRQLADAVQAIGEERLKKNYTTTFWYPIQDEPRNVAERCIVELLRLAKPGPSCGGIEWWVGRLRHGERLRMHFDRDMTLRKQTGRYLHPLRASVLYLNFFPASPTVIFDQVPSADGTSRVPPKPELRQTIQPVPNRYVVFPGNLRHGVRPLSTSDDASIPGFRLSFLVNYWEQRPLPPVCFDYDGTIYPSLQH